MLLPKFDFHEPQTVAEACQMMAEYGPKAKVIAGGTDLMVNMKKKLISPEQLVSVARIKELKKLDSCPGTLRIGSCFTVGDIAASDEIGSKWSALRAGAKALGSPLVRNLATIGGNIGTARPAADLPPSLICYGASGSFMPGTVSVVFAPDAWAQNPGSIPNITETETFTVVGPTADLTNPSNGGSSTAKTLNERGYVDVLLPSAAGYASNEVTLLVNGSASSSLSIDNAQAPLYLRAEGAAHVFRYWTRGLPIQRAQSRSAHPAATFRRSNSLSAGSRRPTSATWMSASTRPRATSSWPAALTETNFSSAASGLGPQPCY